MEMRLRVPELLEEHSLTAYEVAKRSDGRISETSLYRLTRQRGKVRYLDLELAEALCDVLGVAPGELLQRDGKGRDSRRKAHK
jgi:DNA-binding Xre family transcriptional regulator